MVRQKPRSGNDFLRAGAWLANGIEYSGNVDMNEISLPSKNAAADQLASEIEDLLRRVDALPTLDSRPEGEILGYGEDGIPS